MRYQLAFLRGDETAQTRIAAEGAGALDEPLILFQRARGEVALGRVKLARGIFDRSVELCRRHENPEFAAIVRAMQAFYETELGYVSEPRQLLSEALSF